MSKKFERKSAENKRIPKISICMIVKNEENKLPRLLKSIEPLLFDNFSELIIVDTGSTDSTISIAKKYTEKVYETEWNGFADARNKSISYAKGEWIFILDADNEVPYESCMNLKKMILDPKVNKYNTISLEIRDYKAGSTSYNIFSQTLIFKNDGDFYYTGRIHNIPVFKYPMVKTDQVYMYHYGYQDAKILEKKIKERTLPELLKEYEADPNSMHALIHITQAYSILHDYEKAIFYGEKHRKLLLKYYPNFHPGNYAIYSYLGVAYLNLDKRIRLYEIAKEALKLYPLHLDSAFMLAELFLIKEKDTERAKQYLEKATDLYRKIKSKNLHKYSDFEYIYLGSAQRFFYSLAKIYDDNGEADKADKTLMEIIDTIDNKYEPSYYSILLNRIKNKKIDEFLYYFDRYWRNIENKNLTLLNVIRENIVKFIKSMDDDYKLIEVFFSYVKTLEYEISIKYSCKNLKDFEELFENTPKNMYPEWIATVLVKKYYDKTIVDKFFNTVRFLIGKDKYMDRVLKILLLKLKEKGV